MSVTNAEEARAWLKSWGGRPPLGLLWAAVRGVRTAYGLTRGERTKADLAEALRVLEEKFLERT